jgi:peptidyl-prolyl cis-trans isomerase B (cyclophilin B)
VRKWILVLALVSIFNLVGLTGLNWPEGEVDAAASKANLAKAVMVKMATSKGTIDIAVYPALMPVTCANFLKLVDSGFYNGLVFHRVEDWVVQGGDPKGNGTGGPGWSIKLETHPDLKNVRGAVAMARAAHPDSAGSQFYILKTDASWLDGQYAVFGTVVKGMEVVDKLGIGDKMKISRQK